MLVHLTMWTESVPLIGNSIHGFTSEHTVAVGYEVRRQLPIRSLEKNAREQFIAKVINA